MRSSQVENVGPWMHGAAGICGGIVSTVLFYPLDMVRSRRQAQDGTEARKLSGVRQLISSNGVSTLYRGVTSAVMAHSIGWGLYLYIFRKAQGQFGTGHPLHDFAAAATASTITATLTNPLFVLKTRRQLSEGKADRKSMTLKGIVRTEGIRGLMAGLGPQLLLSSHTAIQITLYEAFKRTNSTRPEQPSTQEVVMGATLSKVAAAVITNPIEVIRTRMQDYRNSTTTHSSVGGAVQYKTLSQTFHTILRREGVKGLYHGMGLNIVRVVPSTMVGFLCYEYVLAAQRAKAQVTAYGERLASY